MSWLETFSQEVAAIRMASSGLCRLFVVTDDNTHLLSFGLSRSTVRLAFLTHAADTVLLLLHPMAQLLFHCQWVSGLLHTASGGGLRSIRLI